MNLINQQAIKNNKSASLITDYHAKYFAHDLLRSSTEDGIEKISRSLFDVQGRVDLNPHQIEAALFALKSPVSKGVILADEVGLGKTIEAGIVLCQYWAERKRRLLVVCPASLRKQWGIELEEKFNIPSVILEARTWRILENDGHENPFLRPDVIICSYQFLNSRKDLAKLVNWDLAVIDEAHKLRNAYRKSNVLGQSIKWALEDTRKLLLTATPLQNSLMELFGLSTIIDDYLFGDPRSFRQMYVNETDMQSLKTRLRGFCKRALRHQVKEYVNYTNRKAITIRFAQTDQEFKLYQSVSDFLQNQDTYALPTSQKSLITLVIRKILASSSFALIATLETIKKRLQSIYDELPVEDNLVEALMDDESLDEEEVEELGLSEETPEEVKEEPKIDKEKLLNEIKQLEAFIEQAKAIKIDSKTQRLKEAIEKGFAEGAKMPQAQRKMVVFTESRRTQQYLKDYLDANGYRGKVVTFNGTNTDPDSKKVYDHWLEKNKNTNRVSGSTSSDKRNAIIEHFRDEAEILIATESAAEGINLQFCNLVINYDLPWNPQRIEQRIGRCHRYGQKCDVVVINFLNERNEVDRRVYDILNDKFTLFDGVFGASDEVLGSLESGVDFEKEVLKICQECRNPDEIQKAFAELQARMDEKIKSKLKESQEILIEHFDEDVHSRLKFHREQAEDFLGKMERRFWGITKNILKDSADFEPSDFIFNLKQSFSDNIRTGRYQLISKFKNDNRAMPYRMSDVLGEHVLDQAKQLPMQEAEIVFDISNHPVKISVVEALIGKTGSMILSKLTVNSFETDEYLLFNAFDGRDKDIHPEVCAKMFECDAQVNTKNLEAQIKEKLQQNAQIHIDSTINHVMERNNTFYQEECERLFRWSDDLEASAEKELKDTKNKLRLLNREMRASTSVQEKHDIELKIKETEKIQRRQRQRIFDVQDEIEAKRDMLIEKLQTKMKQKTQSETLFLIQWKVV
ncbi:MAG: DEAD/DEAH box helicase [Candidatus Omnitrophica bacterium]|nr:DEAD/DEAH box helicase [Candidatus Omnitrophota bacterium]